MSNKKEIDMELSGLILFLLIALDAFLWIGGTVFPLSETNRFRTYSSAVLLLALILSSYWGWQMAAGVVFAGLWIAAIVWSTVRGQVAT